MKHAYIVDLPASYQEYIHISDPRGSVRQSPHYHQKLLHVSCYLVDQYNSDDYKLNHDHIIFTEKKKAAQFSGWLNELDCGDAADKGLFYNENDFMASRGTINYMFHTGEAGDHSDHIGRNRKAEYLWLQLRNAGVGRYWFIRGLFCFEDRTDGVLAQKVLEAAIVQYNEDAKRATAFTGTITGTAITGLTGFNNVTSSYVNFNANGITLNNTKLDAAACTGYTEKPVDIKKLVAQKVKRALKRKAKACTP
jgi:hypothetical protein